MTWVALPIAEKIYQNVEETALAQRNARLENAYVTDLGGIARFPGRKAFATTGGMRNYLFDWRGDLIAVTDEGRFYRIDQRGNAEDVTGIPLSGGRRPSFDKTPDELLAAGGGPILRLAQTRTEALSQTAPNSTHVGYIDGYVLAIEPDSGRFYISDPDESRAWDPLNVFTAQSKPDNLLAMVVTPFREVLMAGEDSIEQWEPLQNNVDQPFAQRWTSGQGLAFPYTLIATDVGSFGVNKHREFVRISGQSSRRASEDVSRVLETGRDANRPDNPSATYSASLQAVDNWKDAWCGELRISGRVFVVLQVPYAVNPYGSAGLTLLYDTAGKRWASLYDWDDRTAAPSRWAPWSIRSLWGRHFVGVAGGVQELDTEAHDAAGGVQRFLFRSGHLSKWGKARVDGLRIRLRRGVVGSNDARPRIGLRVNRDNRGFGRTIYRELGRAGERDMVIWTGPLGIGRTWQFEIAATDAAPIEIASAEAQVMALAR